MSRTESARLPVPKTHKLYIGGEFPRSESGRSYVLAKPGAKYAYAQLCLASRKDLRAAVDAAKAAQPGWAGRSAYNRGQILYRMAEMIEGRGESWRALLRDGLGLTAAQATRAFEGVIDALVYFAGATDKYPQVIGAVNPVAGPHHSFTTPEPTGVIGLIFPDEPDPAAIAARIAAAIAAGNSVIALLPDRAGGLVAEFGEAFATADLPGGVVNLLSGDAAELTPQFASHMEIQGLAFLRDEPQQRTELERAAADNMKRCVASHGPLLALERVLDFVEYKTVWHPIGS
ncbi:MAG: aldehyde dehydrogenase family protein [Thermomonas sp.]|uniref:aldehyde dehydrogenase family protein n=1 Tax=Thermomonas sp. TaxID=1971895 RepID=UPI001B70E282|nr:aldehyde dehydrogenase family protein [Thermomonas sp.]MBP7158547.1 aldehyde dehydrogenase family protein [Thermomonas sp.]MBP8648631.1 aldehyde dehydrogenase family protein [Thermomonas sp.]